MSDVAQIARRYIEQKATADPIWATLEGLNTDSEQLTDYSPDGALGQHVDNKTTLTELARAEVSSAIDQRTVAVMTERLNGAVAMFDSMAHLRHLAANMSPVQDVVNSISVLPTADNDDWNVITKRTAAVDNCIDGYIAALEEGIAVGVVSTKRQTFGAAAHADAYAGVRQRSEGFFASLVSSYTRRPDLRDALAADLKSATDSAAKAYERLGSYLLKTYMPKAANQDDVGRDRYELAMQTQLGGNFDALELYEWGWDEIARLSKEIGGVCNQLIAKSSLSDVIHFLDTNGESFDDIERLVEWLQDFLDVVATKLIPAQFDLPEQLKTVRVALSPSGSPANAYYTPASADLRQPGTYWLSHSMNRSFPKWSQISTAFHEGLPGHHMQLSWARFMTPELSMFQRHLSVAGHSEGWALYAERLADELGLLDNPEYRLDMLLKAYFRAVRVVIDIGLHLKLPLPAGQPFHPNEAWSPSLAVQLLNSVGNLSAELVRSEVDRYLGCPGQALTYKVGERVWLEARAERQAALGSDFDLRAFHHDALSLGPMGLDQLRRELGSMPVRP